MKHLEKMREIAKALESGRVVVGDEKIVAAVKRHVAAEKEFEKVLVVRKLAYVFARS